MGQPSCARARQGSRRRRAPGLHLDVGAEAAALELLGVGLDDEAPAERARRERRVRRLQAVAHDVGVGVRLAAALQLQRRVAARLRVEDDDGGRAHRLVERAAVHRLDRHPVAVQRQRQPAERGPRHDLDAVVPVGGARAVGPHLARLDARARAWLELERRRRRRVPAARRREQHGEERRRAAHGGYEFTGLGPGLLVPEQLWPAVRDRKVAGVHLRRVSPHLPIFAGPRFCGPRRDAR